ncbi:hypothetical protein JCM11251_007642 [Rhodosporidiobolus azoricus]
MDSAKCNPLAAAKPQHKPAAPLSLDALFSTFNNPPACFKTQVAFGSDGHPSWQLRLEERTKAAALQAEERRVDVETSSLSSANEDNIEMVNGAGQVSEVDSAETTSTAPEDKK